MDKIEKFDTLKDIITIKCDEFKDRVAFLEKNKVTRQYEDIKYGKLKEDAINLGTALLEILNLENKKIAVIGENSYRWFVTYIATVCGVGIIVPLDKELPANEILNLLKRSDAKCIVYSSRKKEVIDEIKDKLDEDTIFIDIDKDASDDTSYSFDQLIQQGKELIDTGSTKYIDKKIDREAFSVLLFTSGTTAKSKGVMLSHKNLVTNIYSCMHIIPNSKDFRYFSVLPIHHTYEFMIDYLNPISNGACIIICEGLKYIVKNMQETKPTIIITVPLLVENIVKKIEKGIKETKKENVINTLSTITTGLSKVGIDLRRLVFKKVLQNFGGDLKIMLCGGAPLDKKMAEKIQSYGITILQGYGLTETSPLIAGTTPENIALGTVGKAIKDVEIRIDLQENENTGEIMAKGDNVMIGYYENEEETSKVLKKGWFYTGDIGYFDERGNLVISSRIKNIIVTKNGKKIFPEELEFLINRIPLVKESMVYGYEENTDKSDNDIVVAVKVTLDEEYLEENYGEHIPSEQEIYDTVWAEIKKINRTQVPYKSIKKLEIKKEDFNKTTTMKIKRFEEMKKK